MGLHGRGGLDVIIAEPPKVRGKNKRHVPKKRSRAARVQAVLDFCADLPVTKGICAGANMELLPDQIEFIRAVYGADQPVRIGIKSAPRGNGKTGLVAALALCHLLGPEAEQRGEVYSAACDRMQASIVFAEMAAIVIAVPAFRTRVNILRHSKKMEVMSGVGAGSTYEALSADARRAHGLSPTLWVYDELAQAKDRQLLDNLQTAMGKRRRSLGLVISTQAPTDQHPLSQLIDDALTGTDPSIVCHITAAPEDADPFSPEVIRSVNPALGHFLNEADLLSEAERARRLPAFESAFRNLRLNQRVDSAVDERLCPLSVWKSGNAPVELERLRGRPCFAALDLSAKHDLTSLTLVFPSDDDPPVFDVVPLFWTPRDQLEARRPQERDRFRDWIARDLIYTIPGPTIQFAFVAHQLVQLAKHYDIRVLGYDAWRIDDFKTDLAAIDPNFPVPVEAFAQTLKQFAPAIQWFRELVETGRIRHGGHPVLTACVANAVLYTDPSGNHRIDKDKSAGRGPVRIDGAVTLVMALELAKRFVGNRIDCIAMVA